jgi:hypothetical protein
VKPRILCFKRGKSSGLSPHSTFRTLPRDVRGTSYHKGNCSTPHMKSLDLFPVSA